MKKILLFGFDSLPEILALAAVVKPFSAELVPVAKADYYKTLAVLAGEKTDDGTAVPYAGGTLGERMMVLCGLEKELDALLPALAKAGAGAACMKAVLTPHNRAWSAVALHAELLRERREMQGR